MLEILILLNKWFGIKKVVSLVDWHESDDAELTANNYQLSLSALLHDEIISLYCISFLRTFHNLCYSFSHRLKQNSALPIFVFAFSFSSTSFPSSLFIQQLNTNIQNVLRIVLHSYQRYEPSDHSVTHLPKKSFQNDDHILF